MKKGQFSYALLSSAIATVLASPGLHAEASSTENSMRVIDEVVVTARRKEESLQSVPITITAFDQESLSEKSINTTQDLQYSVPGVFFTGSGSRTNTLYSIRGQAKPVIGQGSPGVLTYFNDVPLPTNASSVPQYDVGSLQVLKGPQGTLFGRNSTGGAILVYAEKPSYDFGGYFEVGLGDYDYKATKGAVNIPLIDDKLALRLATQFQHRDGYTENLGDGIDQDQLDSQSFRASLLYEPTESVTNLTVLDYHKNDASTSGAILIRGVGNFAALADAQKARGPRNVYLNLPSSREDVEQIGFTNRTDIEFDNWGITNILGYRYNDVFVRSQIDGMDGLGIGLHVLEGHQKSVTKQWTEELQLKGQLLDNNLDWLLGFFYLKSEPEGTMASATGFFTPARQTYQFLEEESKAVFANLTYNLDAVTDGLSFNIGARYTKDESELCSGYGEFPMADQPAFARIESCNKLDRANTLNQDSNATTWTVGLDWQINDDNFAYLTSRKGYRAGGINGPTLAGALKPYQFFEPEETVDVELGLRSDWQIQDISGRLNIAVFRTEADDAQVAAAGLSTSLMSPPCELPDNPFLDGDCDPLNDPAQTAINQNVGKTQIDGLELELTVMPTERLTLSFTGTWLDSKTKEYNPPEPLVDFYPPNEIPILYTAEKSYTAGIRYEIPVDDSIGEVVLNANYYYSGEVEMITYTADEYDITNLRADWNNIAGTTFDLGLFVRNAFDEEAIIAPAALNSAAPFGTVLYNEPRMWGVELQYRFGAN